MKRSIALLGLVTLASSAAAEPSPESTVALRWALGARGSEGAEVRSITKDTRLEGGTLLKFLVEPRAPAAVYLIHVDASDDLQVLHRKWTPSGVGGAAASTFVPTEPQWFALDRTPGRETFFLLASRAPLAELDRLLDRFAAADAAGRKSLAPQVVSEIRDQLKAHRNFARAVERPAVIGGQTRGEPATEDLRHLAIDVSAEGLYGKTITIDH